MTMKVVAGKESSKNRPVWFVNAMLDSGDQTQRFLQEGIWENSYHAEKHRDLVKKMMVGDRIAIKTTYNQKNKFSFGGRENLISTMLIKATGVIAENRGDGYVVRVEWDEVSPQREWYFYTFPKTIWCVYSNDWMANGLIEFAFNNQEQDIKKFRNHSFWKERFGDKSDSQKRFKWVAFYEALARRLVDYKDNRMDLVTAIHRIASQVKGLSNLTDQLTDGTSMPLQDICPFTVMGVFNRGITNDNRIVIARELANFLGVIDQPVPDVFDGIPTLNNQKSWFFGFEKHRKNGDIDCLWSLFETAIEFSDGKAEEENFITAYEEASKILGTGWNLTIGLYWLAPEFFPTLDSQSRQYINEILKVNIGLNGEKKRSSATDYLALKETLMANFMDESYPVHSFPELSYKAWTDKGNKPLAVHEDDDCELEESLLDKQIPIYSSEDIFNDGCFIDEIQLEKMLERLKSKKNIILQGPPGTGKTWLAKRLAFALIGQKNDEKLRAVQFHPNLSYEDFVRGWRPSGDGKLAMVDGPFMEMIVAAANDPDTKHVFVIEEINRGNPAQIFGEMLTLLEADKRNPDAALELCYRKSTTEKVFIPDNLYVIGTMNIADRSLALVDLALRRRFAFIDMEPKLGDRWRNWVSEKCDIDIALLSNIEQRLIELNVSLSLDPSLGRQFQIGHSFVTPPNNYKVKDANEWFKQVVQTEIAPLLEEYWFDAPDKARHARERLLEGL